ncbi:MAG: hypothetical protein ACOCRX_03355 [Candidatus Woesearchaeota archaeon]
MSKNKCMRCKSNKRNEVSEYCDSCFKKIIDKRLLKFFYNGPYNEINFYEKVKKEVFLYVFYSNQKKIKYAILNDKPSKKVYVISKELFSAKILHDLSNLNGTNLSLFLDGYDFSKDELIEQNKINFEYISPYQKISNKEIDYYYNKYVKDKNIEDINDKELNFNHTDLSKLINNIDKEKDKEIKEIINKGYIDSIKYITNENEEVIYSLMNCFNEIKDKIE